VTARREDEQKKKREEGGQQPFIKPTSNEKTNHRCPCPGEHRLLTCTPNKKQ
jgi:hypothetical protein